MTATLLACSVSLVADSIKGSKHDLSNTNNPASTQVCLFCHTPHNANNAMGPATVPLWNRYVDTSKVFTVYSSASMSSLPGNPSQGPSAACLGCHDGTVGRSIVNGVSGSDKHDFINRPSGFSAACSKCHVPHAPIGQPIMKLGFGTDLSNMHPISVAYPTPSQDPAFLVPADAEKGWSDVKLYKGKVECASCHNVHDPAIAPFLRKSNDGSGLCLSCHIK